MNSSPGTSVSAENDPRPVIFVLDDEETLLELNAVTLEPLGYRVCTFRDPVEAMQAFSLADPRPALILTDYAMDEMDGLAVISACRRLNPGQKAILLSGTADEIFFRKASEKPNRFLAKPYQCQQLLDLVREVLAE